MSEGPPEVLPVFQAAPLVWEDANGIHEMEWLDLDPERRNVAEALEGTNVDAVFKPATPDLLSKFLAEGHDILHLSCHGHSAYAAIENGWGGLQPLIYEDLIQWIKDGGNKLKFVFISACQSREAGDALVNAGVVDHVVCCREKGQDLRSSIAGTFTKHFYTSLCRGNTVGAAFKHGFHGVKHSAIDNVEEGLKQLALLPDKGNHEVSIFGSKRSGGYRLQIEPANRNWNLPHPPDGFIGRQIEMYQIVKELTHNKTNARFIQIEGPPGIGKVTVARGACHYAVERHHTFRFSDCVWVSPFQCAGTELTEKLQRLFRKLCDCLSHDVNDEGFVASIQEVVLGMKEEYGDALLVVDARKLLLQASRKKLETFLTHLFIWRPRVRVITVCPARQHFTFALSCFRKLLKIGPLERKSSLTMFGNHCDFVKDGSIYGVNTTADLVRLFMPEEKSNLQRTKEIFSLIGDGKPAEIRKSAEMGEAKYNELIQRGIPHLREKVMLLSSQLCETQNGTQKLQATLVELDKFRDSLPTMPELEQRHAKLLEVGSKHKSESHTVPSYIANSAPLDLKSSVKMYAIESDLVFDQLIPGIKSEGDLVRLLSPALPSAAISRTEEDIFALLGGGDPSNVYRAAKLGESHFNKLIQKGIAHLEEQVSSISSELDFALSKAKRLEHTLKQLEELHGRLPTLEQLEKRQAELHASASSMDDMERIGGIDHERHPDVVPELQLSEVDDSSFDPGGCIVGVEFSGVTMDERDGWAEYITKSKTNIERLLQNLLRYGDLLPDTCATITVETVQSNGRERAFVKLQCEIELRDDLLLRENKRVKEICRKIARHLKRAGATEDELDDLMIGEAHKGSLVLLLEASRSVFSRLFSEYLNGGKQIALSDSGDASIVAIAPAFLVRGPFSLLQENEELHWLSDEKPDAVLWREEDLSLVIPISNGALPKLLTGGVRKWECNEEEEWQKMPTVLPMRSSFRATIQNPACCDSLPKETKDAENRKIGKAEENRKKKTSESLEDEIGPEAPTYKRISKVYYEERDARRAAQKASGQEGQGINNNGWDDENYDYILTSGELFYGRYIIKERIGKGRFGQVVRGHDMETNKDVAIKIIKSKELFLVQAETEIELLSQLCEKDAEDQHNIVRLLTHFIYRNHQCLVFEMLSLNLYELLKNTQFGGVSLNLIRKFAKQILKSLGFLARPDVDIIHCDLKPENILLRHPKRSGVKVIDFGSSCRSNRRMYSYLQSRFYRSPEVMLGLPYSVAIDMWSLGCILAEMHTGEPLFSGSDQFDQMQKIVKLLGMMPNHMLEQASDQHRLQFFSRTRNALGIEEWVLRQTPAPSAWTSSEPKEKVVPSTDPIASLSEVIGAESTKRKKYPPTEPGTSARNYEMFVDLVHKMLAYDPTERIKPQEALNHPFILSALRVPLVTQQLLKSFPHKK